ncbi:MAG: CGNR zinc finger domain-containing protein [Actinomycetia bacterium]|nr:CGNR zinc finger domain-containing protein [Actinomycetes bacterium]
MPGNVSLDFANTVEWHAGPNPEERLTSYAAALDWGLKHGLLTDSQVQVLREKAQTCPGDEAEALRRIVALREAVYRIFSALSHRAPLASADLETLNAELTEALPHVRLVVTEGFGAAGEMGAAGQGAGPPTAERDAGSLPGFEWAWTGMEDHLTSLLWPVARSATDLLTSRQLVQVRECADDACGWLFLDTTKNASRRWCDMADCGNRAKARRYRARRKEAVHE